MGINKKEKMGINKKYEGIKITNKRQSTKRITKIQKLIYKFYKIYEERKKANEIKNMN